MATDMVVATVALHSLSRLGGASSPNGTIGWFVLPGLCLIPVMAGATDVIVGHAQVAAFAAGMHTAFLAAAAVALARAILALAVRPGNGTTGPSAAI
jgi:hypothetical protein